MASDAIDLNAEADVRGEAPVAEVSGICDPNPGGRDINGDVDKVKSFGKENVSVDDDAGTMGNAERSGFCTTDALSGDVEETPTEVFSGMETRTADVNGRDELIHDSDAFLRSSETAEQVSGTSGQTHEPMDVDAVDGSRRYGETSHLEARGVLDDLSPSLGYDSTGVNHASSDVGSEDVDMSLDSSGAEEVGVEKVDHGVEDSTAHGSTEGGITRDLKINFEEKDVRSDTENPPVQNENAGIDTMDTKKNLYDRLIFGDKKMGDFSNSDLVWGKIKSHPWWPGQIVDPSNASEMALKYQRKDNFLVAYFGDKTFAWCDDSQLKPFHAFFSQMEKQSSSDVFLDAVGEALSEVSRRVQLAMVCACVPEESISKLKNKCVENAGTREPCIAIPDRSLDLSSFQSTKFLGYLRSLAKFPLEFFDKLDLVIAHAQLLAFYHSKGWDRSTILFSSQEILEGDDFSFPVKDGIAPVSEEKIPARRGRPRKNRIIFPKPMNTPEDERKQKSLFEVMEDGKDAHLIDEDQVDINQKAAYKRLHQRDLNSKLTIPSFGTSFRLGECIRRVATKMIGSSPSSECNGEAAQKGILSKVDTETDNPFSLDVSPHSPEETRMTKMNLLDDNCSLRGLLSQLRLVASVPTEESDFVYSTIAFFTEIKRYRYSVSQETLNTPVTVGRKRGRPKLVHDFHSVKDANFPDASACKKGILKSLPDYCAVDHTELPAKVQRKRGRPKKVIQSNYVQDIKTPLEESSKGGEQDATTTAFPEVSRTHVSDHMKDSYWTNMVIHNNPEKKRRGRKRKEEFPLESSTKKSKPMSPELMPLPSTPSVQQHVLPGKMSPIKSRLGIVSERQVKYFGKKCVESSPTAVILNFSSQDSVPLKKDLMRIFSRYGPLVEAEVLMGMRYASVVFKRQADAEAAFSSAGKCSFFGPGLLSYRLKNLPLISQNSPYPAPIEKNDLSPVKSSEYIFSSNGKTKESLNVMSVDSDPFLEVLVTKQGETTPIGTCSVVSYSGKEETFAAGPNCCRTEVLIENDPDDMEISDTGNSNAEKDNLHLDDDKLTVPNSESYETPVEDKHLVLSFSTGDPKWKDICDIDSLGLRKIGVCAENIEFQDANVDNICIGNVNFVAPSYLMHQEDKNNKHVESQGDASNFNQLEVVGAISNESPLDSDVPIQVEKVVEIISLELSTTVTEISTRKQDNAEVLTRDDVGCKQTCIRDACVAEKYEADTVIESKVLDRKKHEAPEGGCNFEALDNTKNPDMKVQSHERENHCNVKVQTHETEHTALDYLGEVPDTNHKDALSSFDVTGSSYTSVQDYMEDKKIGPRQREFCDMGFHENNIAKTSTASLREVLSYKHDKISTGNYDELSSSYTNELSAVKGDSHVVPKSGKDESLRECSNIDVLSMSNDASTCTENLHVLDVKEKEISKDIDILLFPACQRDSKFKGCDESEFLATKIKNTSIDGGITESSDDKVDEIPNDGGNKKILVDRKSETSIGETTMKISDDSTIETSICDGNLQVQQSIGMQLDSRADAESKD